MEAPSLLQPYQLWALWCSTLVFVSSSSVSVLPLLLLRLGHVTTCGPEELQLKLRGALITTFICFLSRLRIT